MMLASFGPPFTDHKTFLQWPDPQNERLIRICSNQEEKRRDKAKLIIVT